MLIPIPEQQTITAFWNIRPETPAKIAARYKDFINRIKPLHPSFWNWIVAGLEEPEYWDDVQDDLASCVDARVVRNDDDSHDPNSGYSMAFLNSMNDTPQSISMLGGAGAKNYHGSISFHSAWVDIPDPSIVNYQTWSTVFVALIESFDAEFGRAYPSSVVDLDERQDRLFDLAWITYVPPDRARHVVPPETAVVTRLASGGMLLAAGDEIFDARNPDHLARARDILAALEPVQGPSLSKLYAYDWSNHKP